MSQKPTEAQMQAACDETLPDVIAPGLAVLFVGINPSRYSTAVGHHFARPGNRFWPALHRSGFTPRQFAPHDDRALLELGLGLTNIAPRTTARADELDRDELRQGAVALVAKLEHFKPRFVAFVGITAYRSAFERPKAKVGDQATRLGSARVWALPNPSGLNAHYQIPDLARLFGELRQVAFANV